MHRCFASPDAWSDDGRVQLSPAETHHLLHVLRAAQGDEVRVFDGAGREAVAHLQDGDASCANLHVEAMLDQADIPGGSVSIVQVLPKGRRMDLVVEKCTEIGVSSLYPVTSARCVVKLDMKQAASRLDRWRRVALAAARQCQTPTLPTIAPIGTLAELDIEPFDLTLVATLLPGLPHLHRVIDARRACLEKRVAIVIGPEGDLTPEEVDALINGGAIPVSFGSYTLRAETAAIYAASVLAYECYG